MSEAELATILRDKPEQVVLVVGAGVTLGALDRDSGHYQRASWQGLIEHGLDFAVGRRVMDDDDATRLKPLLQSKQSNLWIAAAECLTQALDAPRGGDFEAWLDASIGPLERTIKDRRVLDVLDVLGQQGAVLATVNYDGVLEAATGLRPITWRQPAKIQRLLRRDSKRILHLHGYWEEPESVVLGSSSYAKILEHPHTRAALHAMAMSRTLVFIGHGAGLSDPNWSQFFTWVSEVLPESPYRHYRIVRREDLPQFDEAILRDQRLELVPFDGGHGQLGPFLRALAGLPGASVRSSPEPRLSQDADEHPRQILVLVNVGGHEHEAVTPQHARQQVGENGFEDTFELECTLEPSTAGEDDWQRVRVRLDHLIERVEAAAQHDVCIVLVGRAPLPVFAYLGYRTRRLASPILMVNFNYHSGEWERIGPFQGPRQFPVGAAHRFTLTEPEPISTEPGMNALFVGCSAAYRCSLGDLAQVLGNDAQRTAALCTVNSQKNHRTDPMTEADLAPLSELLDLATRSLSGEEHSGQGLVFAIGGPSWVAFWLARQLNVQVTGAIAFPNFVPGSGYQPALRVGPASG